MPDELHVVSLVTLLDAVHTDGVAVCRITGVTPMRKHILFCLTSVNRLPAANTQLWCKYNFKDYL